MNKVLSTDRRNFLKSTGLLGGGLIVSFMIPASAKVMRKFTKADPDALFKPNGYLRIAPDGAVTVTLAHVEMGQGIWTTLPMLIAEELDADWEKIKVEHSPPGKEYIHVLYGVQLTGGSSSTWSEFDRYRMAGATARNLLVQAAAKQWNIPVSECRTENGFVIAGDKKLSYGELASAAADMTAPAKIELRPSSQWKLIGKGKKRIDSPEKVNGTAKYGIDVKLPGLLTALIAHSPILGGKVKSFDATKAKAYPGVKDVVQIPSGVAVLADNFWAAKKGRDLLKIEWDNGPGPHLDSAKQMADYKELGKTDGKPALKNGNADAAFASSKTVIDAEYYVPYLCHAPMEPINCTVNATSDKCEIFTGTQMPGVDQAAAAAILGLKPEQVTITTPFLGGGFGRRATPDSDFVVEAVQIAKASSKPIKLVWTREDDMHGYHYRSSFYHKVKVGLDNEGYPKAWKHIIVGQSIFEGTPFEGMMQNGIDPSSVEGIADSPYVKDLPDAYVGLNTTKYPVSVLWYRSVGHTHTAYVMETMIDELAKKAGKDPLEYRRKLLAHHPRHLAALNLAADKAGWGKPLPAGRYRGIAVHESFASYVAYVVEASIVKGAVKVHRVVGAIDCGLAVNPDGVKAQMESGVVFGLSMALFGEITFEKGAVKQTNFHDYKVLRMNESPIIEIHIVDTTEKMGGAGEPPVPPVAPALANAIFAATGKMPRKLPINKV